MAQLRPVPAFGGQLAVPGTDTVGATTSSYTDGIDVFTHQME